MFHSTSSATALLETEWVLRSAYRLHAVGFQRLLREIAGLPGAILEDRRLAADALEDMSHGADCAEALHLARTEGCERFVTFDRALPKGATTLSAVPIDTP